jgi:hypothetical protein
MRRAESRSKIELRASGPAQKRALELTAPVAASTSSSRRRQRNPGGGSNATRSRLWKKYLQDWEDREGVSVMVCHFPPGTSKWNKSLIIYFTVIP